MLFLFHYYLRYIDVMGTPAPIPIPVIALKIKFLKKNTQIDWWNRVLYHCTYYKDSFFLGGGLLTSKNWSESEIRNNAFDIVLIILMMWFSLHKVFIKWLIRVCCVQSHSFGAFINIDIYLNRCSLFLYGRQHLTI